MDCIRRHQGRNPDYKTFPQDASQPINSDIETSMSTARTLEVMDVCKIKIIGPFNMMLTMVGWRSLMTQFHCAERCSIAMRILDKALLLLFISLLVFSYVYQVLACRFKMNVEDKIMTMGPRLTTLSPNHSTKPYHWNDLQSAVSHSTEAPEYYMECKHISTTYVLPNLIHFVAFILGIIHYRIRENEDIYGLMEKTLQYSSTLGMRKNNHFVVSKMMKLWMVMAVLWVFLAMANHIFYDISYNAYASQIYIFKINTSDDYITSNIKHLVFVLDFMGYTIMCIVTATIVLNYTIYCELVKFYVDAISKKIETRRIKLNMLRNDINNVSGAINLINGMIGKMMGLIFFLKLNLMIVGINNLLQEDSKLPWRVAFRFYYVIHMVPLVLTALIQCVRVNHAMKTFHSWGRHMSVFGYRKETKKELDSFLLFTMGYNSKARLMAIPLEWWQLMIFFLCLTLALVTLIQTSVLDQSPIFKYL